MMDPFTEIEEMLKQGKSLVFGWNRETERFETEEIRIQED